ncbi:hypothetical protein GGI15_004568 [Coemansia interrupta]|uniref:Uncharacterized protein n=1 Tax=Coemansia interrupta TaxID=1126814 RepID=A0A9W8LFV6_9FUNG|nr:hypothetical protein GGI15_004568 [Coemansia interrupta]
MNVDKPLPPLPRPESGVLPQMRRVDVVGYGALLGKYASSGGGRRGTRRLLVKARASGVGMTRGELDAFLRL